MKSYTTLISLLIFTILLTACKKDDPKPETPTFTGTWKAVYFKSESFNYPELTAFPFNTQDPIHFTQEFFLKFQFDNVLTISQEDPFTPSGYYSYSGNYAQLGRKITLSKFDTSSSSLHYYRTSNLYIDSLTTNRLVLRDTTIYYDMRSMKVRTTTLTK